MNLAQWSERLSTIQSKGINTDQIKKISTSGFYQNTDDDKLTCFFCNLKMDLVALIDNPDEEHRKLNPNCLYVQIPLHLRTENPLKNPMKPEYSTCESRLLSFKGWFINAVTPETLAPAGFYYNRSSDKAICHYCDSIFKHWLPGDDPWSEHARGQPDCEWLLFVKGKEFIENAAQNASEETLSEPKSEDESDLEDEPEALEESNTCKICMNIPNEVVLVPCGHCSCKKCSFQFTTCPTCRWNIEKIVIPLLY